jgi:hypothetical protein
VGQVTYLVIESATRDNWYVPVPWQYAQVRPDAMTVVLPVTAAQFAAAPGFNKDIWPTSFTPIQKTLQSYWANPAQAVAGQPLSPGTFGAMEYLRAKDVTDVKIVSPQGLKLGKIKDLAINWQNTQPGAAAQFGYVIMELDDNLGRENVMVPIPWRLIRVTPGQETLVMNINPNVLLTAPNFFKGAMPNLYTEPMNGTLNQYWSNK